MGENSKIEWTDHTWNPWVGCKKISSGCKYCYMFRDQKRYGNDPLNIRRTSKATFDKPLKWSEPARVFTCSWSDFFILQANEWRDDAWDIIRQTPHLTYLVLTKRSRNIKACLPEDWGFGWPNVWLGVTVEDEANLDRVFALSQVPAAVRFVSYEPALEFVDFGFGLGHGFIDWLISGGESGSSRKADLDWFRSVRDQCESYGVPYFHKQHGGTKKIDGAWGGRLLDGQIHADFPEKR